MTNTTADQWAPSPSLYTAGYTEQGWERPSAEEINKEILILLWKKILYHFCGNIMGRNDFNKDPEAQTAPNIIQCQYFGNLGVTSGGLGLGPSFICCLPYTDITAILLNYSLFRVPN